MHSATTVLAYLDDIFVVGPSAQAENLLVELKSDLNSINLNICDRKCEFYLPVRVFHQFGLQLLVLTSWVFQLDVIIMSNLDALRLLPLVKSFVPNWGL